jgi:hypothetical protein
MTGIAQYLERRRRYAQATADGVIAAYIRELVWPIRQQRQSAADRGPESRDAIAAVA